MNIKILYDTGVIVCVWGGRWLVGVWWGAFVGSFVQHLWGLAYCSQNQGLRGGTRQEPMKC